MVTYDTQDGLEEKKDRLTTMMSKLTAKGNGLSIQFKTKIFQNKRRGQTRNFYDRSNYDQKKTIEIGIDQVVKIEGISSIGRIQCGQN